MKQSLLGSVLILLISAADACMRVSPTTPGMPAVPCRACAANAVHVKQVGETDTARPMTTDVTVTTGVCAQRTFTCVGNDAGIELFVGHVSVGTVMTPKDMATITATCTAAGTWEYMGRLLSDVECSYLAPANKCKLCTEAQIQKLQRPGRGAKEFFDDSIDLTETCAMRTFECEGKKAGIEIFDSAMVPIGIEWGIGDGLPAFFTVTCNADGTAWEKDGRVIAAVECADAFLDP